MWILLYFPYIAELLLFFFLAGFVLHYLLRGYAPLMTFIRRHSLAFDILVILGSAFCVFLFFI